MANEETSTPLTSESREEMSAYLVEERLYTEDEVAAFDDDELREHYVGMHEELSELDAVSGDEAKDDDEIIER